MESAATNSRQLQSENGAIGATAVHVVNASGCYRCGNHQPFQCYFKTTKCHNCGKTGHIKSACRQAKNPPAHKERKPQFGKKSHSKAVKQFRKTQ